MKTKRLYAERVKDRLLNQYQNSDLKIDERFIFLALDSVVNSLARKSYFDNWKLTGAGVDAQFLTFWDGATALTVVDDNNGNPSYFELPVNYADLPKNGGINEIWMQKYGKTNHSVVIIDHRDVRRYSENMAGNVQGRLSGYVQGTRFVFNNPNNGCKIKAQFGNAGLALVVRDSSLIALDAPYPIPSSAEEEIVEKVYRMYVEKRMMPIDKVRDTNDQP
jgi:hypothetical protein